MLTKWVVYVKYFYQKGIFGTNKKAETTICVEATSEEGASTLARRQLEGELKKEGCRLVSFYPTPKKM